MPSATDHLSSMSGDGPCDAGRIAELTRQLLELREDLRHLETALSDELDQIDPERRPSARNLVHYVSLRGHDLRPLQERLVECGLSSLGRCESYVMSNINCVLAVLQRLGGEDGPGGASTADVDFSRGRALIQAATRRLLGEQRVEHGACIMVTMPSQAADDYDLVRDLLAGGMDVMRINCAHDDEAAWSRMIANLRRAESELGRRCRVAMDLGGPKIRTGPIEPGPPVLRWRPQRDSFGRVVAAAQLLLCEKGQAAATPAADPLVLPVEGELLEGARVGDTIEFRDAAGRPRRLRVRGKADGTLLAESRQTAYVVPGTPLRLVSGTGGANRQTGRVGQLAPRESYLVLYRGDRLRVSGPEEPGRPARYDDRGRLVHEPSIGCTLPEIFHDVRRGERILFDDGKIEGVIQEVRPGHLVVEITRAAVRGTKLRADKGINLPDSDLKLPALTGKDVEDLAFVVRTADIVSYSFVRRVDDVDRLQAELKRLGHPELGIVLKIENRQAFENLPRLLLAAMRSPATGVMIARGDLAVECGYERLAEIQEEILWMCEAAHLPVIWATQVLESLAKRGMPSRAEVTDAAMGVRAECVMLNKGPHILLALATLDDILRRMVDHQTKKRPMLRRLRLAERIIQDVAGPETA